ncbi:MAG: DUF456 domain-containing protein [Bacteroidales bacterium]|nr:DUF456 domain-containing protein [Bacteroidales bacterium]MBQ6184698.1 DUF456 domain-containing protein [Bacteroidales bacterium]
MSTIIIILAVVAGIIGIAGSILPGLPGPPVSWAGLLILYIWGSGTNGAGEPISTSFLLIWLAITVVVCVIDYVVPAYFTRVTGGSKAAGRGAIVGLIVGMLVPPVGIILGTLAGAFLAEFIVSRKSGWQSTKSAVGALLGFLFGTGIKLIASGLMMYYIIVYLK